MIKPIRALRLKTQIIRSRYFDKFVFIHINKTGGSSIETALNLPFEHQTALEKIAILGRMRWDRCLTFTVVRNPWDKVVSHYHYRRQRNKLGPHGTEIGFKEWVKRCYRDKNPLYYDFPKMFMPQLNWIADVDGKILCDEICRFENFKTDFDKICARLGKTAILPHLKRSEHRPYQDYYDAETADIIGNWFAKDIESFGYAFR